jgi:hypothetical protein
MTPMNADENVWRLSLGFMDTSEKKFLAQRRRDAKGEQFQDASYYFWSFLCALASLRELSLVSTNTCFEGIVTSKNANQAKP